MSLFKNANNLFQSGDYEAALELYKGIAEKYGSKKLVEYSIQQCKERIKENKNHIIFDNSKKVMRSNSLSIDNLYCEVEKETLGKNNQLKPDLLVSVVMTAHNTEDFIEASINSLLLQTYKNIEIIIVDDCSTDKTFEIATRISNANSKVKVFRLNSNLGTYYAKNTGILKSRGDIIFFQDSDDVCHHERIERSVVSLCENTSAIAVRTAYSRVNPQSHEVIEVNGYSYKLGLITLGVYKKVFHEIGFFNCTTKASDDEFYHRLVKVYGTQSIVNVPLPLYYNTMRSDSLFSDMVEWNGNNKITQKTSESRQLYLSQFKLLHSNTKKSEFKNIFHFPRVSDAIPVSSDMTKLVNPKLPVYVNICSIPSRIKQLQYTVGVLKNQCDHFHIYLDGYKEIPDFLLNLGKKATIVHCTDKKLSIRDNGKFILLEQLVKEKKDAYYITCDDDIRYPADYINSMIKKLNYYDDKVTIGVHGVLFPSRVKKYFSQDRIVYNFSKALERDRAVNILGTGTVAFRTNIFSDFSLGTFEKNGMVDIYFSILCKKNNILQICISRPANWLTEDNQNTETLFNEFRDKDESQSLLVIQNIPWGYDAISPLLEGNDKYLNLIPSISYFNK